MSWYKRRRRLRFLRYSLPRLALSLVIPAAVPTGCGTRESPDEERTTGVTFYPGSPTGLDYDVPEGWIQEPPSSSMRQAQFRLPRVEGDPEDAELAIFHFGGGGGSTQANIDRWVGQFSNPDGSPIRDPQVSERDSNGIHLTIVDVSGTYNEARGPMMVQTTPKPNFRMLAAVAEGQGGPWFLKLTGPKKTVDRWEESFYTFLETLQAKR